MPNDWSTLSNGTTGLHRYVGEQRFVFALLNVTDGVLSRVRADGQWGEVIPRIPAYFRRTYGVANLYCVDLAFFHRAFYAIFHRAVIFLDLVDHPTYSRWFPGRRRGPQGLIHRSRSYSSCP